MHWIMTGFTFILYRGTKALKDPQGQEVQEEKV